MRKDFDDQRGDATRNYVLIYPRPNGWIDVPHQPQTLFIYRDPKTGVQFRCSMNQVVADINPTPSLTAEVLARELVQNTKDRMPGWKGKIIDGINANGIDWHLVSREADDRRVVSAFAVKGNTTVLLAMVAQGEAHPHADLRMDDFREYVRSMKLEERKMTELLLPPHPGPIN